MRYLYPLALAAMLSFLTACQRDTPEQPVASDSVVQPAPRAATRSAVPQSRVDTSSWTDTTRRGDTTVVAWGRSITAVTVIVDSSKTSVFAKGVPWGLWGLLPAQLGSLYNGTVLGGTAPWKVLPDIKAKNSKVVLNLADSKMRAPEGGDTVYSLKAATAFVATWDTSVVNPRVRDGTVHAISVADDITDKAQHGNGAPYFARIDSVACMVSKRFAGVSTSVRAMPSQFYSSTGKILYKPKCLTYTWGQYVARHGDVNAYRIKEMRRADSLGVCLIFGLNTTKGGNGSSGVKMQSNPDLYQMSPTEVLNNTKALLPYTSFFAGWWSQDSKISNLTAAYKTVRAIADTTRPLVCKR